MTKKKKSFIKNKALILALVAVFLVLSIVVQQIFVHNEKLALGLKEKNYLILSKVVQKTLSYNERLTSWLKDREEAYQKDIFFIRAKRPLDKKILIVTFSLNDTGCPLMFLYLTQLLQQKGYHVSLLSHLGGRHEEDLKRDKIPYIISKEFFNGSEETEKLLSSFDIIISGRIPQMYFPSQEDKFIWWDHGLLECVPPSSLTEEAIRKDRKLREVKFALSEAKDVVFVSELQQKKLAKCREFPSEVIHNGIKSTGMDMGAPIIRDMQWARKNGKKVFVIVGYIDRIKGQDILVDAVKQLGKKYREKAVFFVIGSEQDKEYALKIREKSKEMPEIVWVGPIEHEKIGGVYERGDVLLVPSRSDTAPLVVLEAAEHKMPSVITENVGSTYITEEGQSGFIIPIENSRALAEKIKYFIDHEEKIKEFGEKSRENYEKYASFEVFLTNWENKINRKLKDLGCSK